MPREICAHNKSQSSNQPSGFGVVAQCIGCRRPMECRKLNARRPFPKRAFRLIATRAGAAPLDKTKLFTKFYNFKFERLQRSSGDYLKEKFIAVQSKSGIIQPEQVLEQHF